MPSRQTPIMPPQKLATFTREQVESHNTAQSCFVTIGNNVYDVTEFVDDHPGGRHLVLEYAGKDVADILKDESSHPHSEAAYEVLEDSLVGILAPSSSSEKPANGTAAAKVGDDDALVEVVDANGVSTWVHPRTGMSSAEDLSRETDYDKDFQKHQFLDLSRPLFPQVWFGGFSKAFYLDQVHRPRHYKGGKSAPLFGNFLEVFTKTPWYAVPLIWLPPVSYGTYLASQGLAPTTLVSYWLFGLFLWTFFEYILHRFLFHLDESVFPLPRLASSSVLTLFSSWLPDNRVGITLHFTLHGIHHYLPMDKLRLVMPPVLFTALAIPFWKLAHAVFYWDWNVATDVFCGGIFGYVCYDLTHYFLHHQNLPLWYKQLKKYHLQHHFLDYQNGFGVTSSFWDRVFGTELPPLVKSK